MKDVIVALLLVLIAVLIVWYLVRQRKKGVQCIGCPYAKNCSGNCSSEKK